MDTMTQKMDTLELTFAGTNAVTPREVKICVSEFPTPPGPSAARCTATKSAG